MFRRQFLYLAVCVLQHVCSSSDDNNCYDPVRLGENPSFACSHLVSTQCLGTTVQEYQIGESVELTCDLSATAPTFEIFKYSCPDGNEESIVDGGRHTITGRTLRIDNVQSGDEGLYTCSGGVIDDRRILCVVVSGLARFATCDPPVQFEYNPVTVTSSNSCYEVLNVTEGQVTLDTRISYSEGGCCTCREDITRFAVRLGTQIAPIIYNCDNREAGSCIDKQGIVVRRESSTYYDFSIELQLNASESVQLVYVDIEVDQPRRGNVLRFWKIFQVTVNPNLSTTSPPVTTLPTNTPTTNDQITSDQTTSDQTTNDPTVGSGGVGGFENSPAPGGAVGGAVGAVVTIVVIVAAVVVIAVVLYKRQNDSESLEKKSKEPFYNSVSTGRPQNTNPVGGVCRESVYDFEGNIALRLDLESKITANV